MLPPDVGSCFSRFFLEDSRQLTRNVERLTETGVGSWSYSASFQVLGAERRPFRL
jgi:hypothetical protein